MRLGLAVALLCFVIMVGWLTGCGSPSAPTGPIVQAPPTTTALTITGNIALTAVGETSQLVAEAAYSDGSRKDVSSTANWTSSNRTVATVSRGLVTAVDFGRTIVFAGNGARGATVTITVLPEGTYILSGNVVEAGNLPIPGARVEIVDGPMSGRAVTTNANGQYAFNGVSGVTQVRAAKDGYVTTTQNVSQDTERVNVQLAASAAYASLGGVYRLVFRASPSCQLPDDASSRSYTATIDQVGPGATLTVTLSDAQFFGSGSVTWNRFTARVLGNRVSFTLWDGYYGVYYGAQLIEKLANNRYLSFVGSAESTVTTPTFTAVFAGSVGLTTTGNGSGPIARCTASDHQLVFTPAGAPAAARR